MNHVEHGLKKSECDVCMSPSGTPRKMGASDAKRRTYLNWATKYGDNGGIFMGDVCRTRDEARQQAKRLRERYGVPFRVVRVRVTVEEMV